MRGRLSWTRGIGAVLPCGIVVGVLLLFFGMFDAAQAAHCIYVTARTPDRLVAIDPAVTVPAFVIPLDRAPTPMTITPDCSTIFVAETEFLPNRLVTVDTLMRTVSEEVELPMFFSAGAMQVTPDGRTVLLTGRFGNGAPLLLFDRETSSVRDSFPADSASAIAVSSDGNTAYLAHDRSDGAAVVMDLTSGEVETRIAIDGPASGVAITPDEMFVLVTTNAIPGFVTVLNTFTDTVSHEIPVDDRPLDIAVTPDGELAYVTHVSGLEAGTVSAIRLRSFQVRSTISVDGGPSSVAIAPDGTAVYVLHQTEEAISVIDPSTDRVVQRIEVEGYLRDIVVVVSGPGCTAETKSPTVTPTPVVPTPTPTVRPSCPGDCNRDAMISVDEVVTVLAIALDSSRIVDCRSADADQDDRVSVDEIIAVVETNLRGCSAPPPEGRARSERRRKNP